MLKKYRLFLIVIIPVLVVLIVFLNLRNTRSISLSPNTLYLTQPVYSFSGILETIDGNTLTISQEYRNNTSPPAYAQPTGSITPTPTPGTVKVAYQVTVSKNTNIYRMLNSIPYLFRKVSVSNSSQTVSLKDLDVGDFVTVNSVSDLRLLKENAFETTSINISPKPITIGGTIQEIEADRIRVKASPLGSATPNDPASYLPRDYEVIVTKDTEISRYSNSGDTTKLSQPEKLALSNLKKDMQVTVYSDVDVTKTAKVKALRIEPFIPAPAPTITPSATPEPTPSPTTSGSFSPLPSPVEP